MSGRGCAKRNSECLAETRMPEGGVLPDANCGAFGCHTLALLAGRTKASARTQAKSGVHLVERFQRGVYCRMHVEDGIQIGQL